MSCSITHKSPSPPEVKGWGWWAVNTAYTVSIKHQCYTQTKNWTF